MAKSWRPKADEALGQNEPVGRRIFDEERLETVKDSSDFSRFDLSHFKDGRSQDVSMDRLGRTGVERKIVSYLSARCEKHGASLGNSGKKFNGWAVIQVKKLTGPMGDAPAWSIVASPVSATDGDDLSDNHYHADARVNENSSMVRALLLRAKFEKHGTVEILRDNESKPVEPIARLFEVFRAVYDRLKLRLRRK